MICYHFFWDLGYFNFIALDLMTQGLPLFFAQSVGASFIIISGISSRLLNLSGSFFRAKFLKRFIILLIICLLITTVTFFLDKDSFIFFGILHFLAICSVIGLLLSKVRNKYILFFFFALSFAVSFSDITFDLPRYFSWLGFNKEVPVSNDFYPLFPWVTFYLFGIWLFESIKNNLEKYEKNYRTVRSNNTSIFKGLQFLGRNSLTVYILHQPIFFSLFFIFIQLTS